MKKNNQFHLKYFLRYCRLLRSHLETIMDEFLLPVERIIESETFAFFQLFKNFLLYFWIFLFLFLQLVQVQLKVNFLHSLHC